MSADSIERGDLVEVIEHKLLNPFERKNLLGLKGEVTEVSELLDLNNNPSSYRVSFEKGVVELPCEVLRLVEKYDGQP